MKVVDFGSRLLLLLGLITLTSVLSEAEGAFSEPTAEIVFSPFRPVGPGSCAARACHGSTDQSLFADEPSKLSHTIWVEGDPHARASQVLHEDRSKAIMNRLGWQGEAARTPQCLACHATSSIGVDHDRPGRDDRILAEGVSCESCHGSAERWLDAHVTFSWKKKTPAQKSLEFGMTPLGRLSERADICVSCHVGAPEDRLRGIPLRDMNHDMIAAGHPRLTFEFAAYLDQMPKHWKERLAGTNARADAWLIGQLSTAKAGSELLESRAQRSSANPKATPWPEFSEYNCYSCHFQLKAEISSWTALNRPADVGLPAWGTWTTPRLRDLVKARPNRAPNDFELHLNDLAKTMRFSTTKAEDVPPQAIQVANDLRQWLRQANRDDIDSVTFLDDLLRDRREQSSQNVANWDDAAQLFLAFSALNKPDSSRTHPSRILHPEVDFESLRKQLAFPHHKDSPVNFQPRIFDETLRRP